MEPTEGIEIRMEDCRWTAIDLGTIARRAHKAVCGELGLGPETPGFAVLATDDATLARLNGRFRGEARATDILSWPASGERAGTTGFRPEDVDDRGQDHGPSGPWHWSGSLGDIAMSFETCAGEAARVDTTLENHVTHLLIHGILHLLGFDHATGTEVRNMRAIETSALAKLGVGDPYRSNTTTG
ncbi:MAG: rRNA maturation RNase YbeY [Paracoccaceae bacterium]|nr:rRNA maturation RNase YbeY [Paracoccaceae bacterium]MDE2915151.1 rRNA maturation RNase YbeY [Paracoccaceae bacterium]